ncbi:hypothetical protein ES332_A07G206000v1 [Gossypium tomentosum]|uniref:Uncharacterized protein n=1 Tax=Gossypium tomentosum TaxID=34277 RepID=A0A5D2PYE7_GOSTO|nr:hypothetical protein ES332_A07G206000v1 [Gossypium tomentosum]
MKKRRELSFESIDRESVNHHHFQSRIKVNHETSDGPASPSPSQRLVLRLSRHQKSVFAILPSPVCEPSYSPVGVQKFGFEVWPEQIVESHKTTTNDQSPPS